MPKEGGFLLVHIGFSKDEKPVLFLQDKGEIISFQPYQSLLTLTFDTTERYCSGWYDMKSGQSYVCPDRAVIDKKFDCCPACQQRTGFNPAFYHASSVSSQQEERNLEPHLLYLAHFGEGIIKVGISHAARNRSRLLEQGARSAIVLETFPTAHIARQYEAQIAAIPGIAETLQIQKKIKALADTYNVDAAKEELMATKAHIETMIGKTFSQTDVQTFDAVYFPNSAPNLENAFNVSALNMISGRSIGMLGSFFFCIQQDTPIFLPLKKYIGYRVILSYAQTNVALPAQQMSFF